MTEQVWRCQHTETHSIVWLPYKPVGPYDCVPFICKSDYDALRQQVEGLMATYVALVDKLGIDTEEAKSAPGKPSDVIVSYVEGLRAENERLKRDNDYVQENLAAAHAERVQLRAELEAARGLIEKAIERAAVFDDGSDGADAESARSVVSILRQALTATPAPEVRHPSESDLESAGLGYPISKEQAVQLWHNGFRSEPITVLEVWEAIGHDIACNPSKDDLLDSLRNMAEICNAHGNDMPKQGERQEAQVMGRVHHNPDHAEPVRAVLNSIGRQLPDNAPLYATPQPTPDVSALVEALERFVDLGISPGSWPELDAALSAADKALATYRKQAGK